MAECYKLLVWCFLHILMLLVPPCHLDDSDCPFCCPPGIERGYGVIPSVDCSQSNPIVTYTKNSSSTIEILRSYYQCTNSVPIQLVGEHGAKRLGSRPRVIPVNEELSDGTTCSFHGCYFDEGLFYIQPVNCTVDINECEVNPPNCSENSHCVDTVGNFACDCDSGYEGDGFSFCEDIDECIVNNTCGENGDCINTNGSYSCDCHPGYKDDGFNYCQDIDECEVNNTCGENGDCVNTNGSFSCDCHPGYKDDGFIYCRDVDECSDTQLNSCSEDATCINGIGNYSCECNEGYAGNGFNCSDIDECEINNICSENGECINTSGSYFCDCHPGYKDDGFNYCQDVDECNDTQLNSCSENAICTNSIGNYSCECNEGYYGNGVICSENDDPSIILPPAAVTIPFVFVALVVVTTALIIVCCISNKIQERRKKRRDRLPFEKDI